MINFTLRGLTITTENSRLLVKLKLKENLKGPGIFPKSYDAMAKSSKDSPPLAFSSK